MDEPIVIEESHREKRDEKPPLRAERNRWFVMSLSLSGVIVILLLFLFYAFGQAQHTKEVVYVKLEPNGSWSVLSYSPNDSQLFYKTTIDSMLQRFAIARYGITPETISSDWGEAQNFMAEKLATDFVSLRGFNAIEKIEAIKKSKNSADIVIERGIEHYDSIDWQMADELSREAIRSNLYLTRTLTVNGKERDPEKLVLNVQWRLKEKKELANKSIDELRLNPIGLEILTYKLSKERI
ncbi:VirB8/TrbF family protein [Vibrio tapetis]|uniref:Bacterial virulence protein VirB8 domain-containing protein n=1 Tax=Vibrio tapetis subsp. tapetis TaxID=1671868 RepID=A0A2N8ZHX2_9VIBR|nr:conjugal transfer protein [Vibrio tapetis]SON51505.1 conserved protein of unknown function [Vibrio tapetis subsp. tapetis]